MAANAMVVVPMLIVAGAVVAVTAWFAESTHDTSSPVQPRPAPRTARHGSSSGAGRASSGCRRVKPPYDYEREAS